MGCLYRYWRIAKILTDRLENSTINIVKYVDVPLGGGLSGKAPGRSVFDLHLVLRDASVENPCTTAIAPPTTSLRRGIPELWAVLGRQSTSYICDYGCGLRALVLPNRLPPPHLCGAPGHSTNKHARTKACIPRIASAHHPERY